MRDGTKEVVDADELSKRSIAQDLNRHAAVVLEGRPLGRFKFYTSLVLFQFPAS